MFEQKFALWLVVFSNFTGFYCFFDFLDRIFFLNGFPNSLIVRLGLVFCLVNENSLNCTSRLVLLCHGPIIDEIKLKVDKRRKRKVQQCSKII